MSNIESNTAVIEIGPLKISFPMSDPGIGLENQDQSQVPMPGEYWGGQGGIYVGTMPALEGNRPYHLIASVDEEVELQWGKYGQKIEGAGSRIDGSANTRAILAADGEHPAAKWAAEYKRDGHTDFYLPAQRELNLCFAAIVERFEKAWYWSSTQYSASFAWGQDFGDGTQGNASKNDTGRARAVRRIEI